ncbi:GNAT family N-acetyltransferase [Microvirga sp. 2MCAF35]|uniref:GNAT family N-acetyltransferase n=1 Tax=Microvirga sp. 2MCAF35 TaxID=3232987 RepID=UPI003F9B04A1
MSILDRFIHPLSSHVEAVGTESAARLSAIHASAFARAWSTLDFERLLGERGVVADGLFLEPRTQKWTPLLGFIRCSFSLLAHRMRRTRRAASAKTGSTFPPDALGRATKPVAFALSRIVLDEAEIITVAVAPEARGKGHARPLLAHHLDALSRRGVARVHLEVEEGNAPAIALYRRAGFRDVGRREGYYPKADGTKVAALTMALDL